MGADTVEILLAHLRDGGGRVTTIRRLVLTALLQTEGRHPTAVDLLEIVRKTAPDVHASTVYRNLEELERLGTVIHTHLGHGASIYHLATSAHGHLVCELCARTVEAPRELFDELAHGAKRRLGFVLRPYHFAVFGLCADCAAQATAVTPDP